MYGYSSDIKQEAFRMKRTSGFTTVELLVVIAIIGIISAIAVPNLIAWRGNYQLRGTAREVQAAINGARLAAIKENAMVTVTFNAGARQVQTAVTNRATGVQRQTTTQLKPGTQIASTTFGSNAFRFNSRGIPINIANNSFAAGTVTVSNSSGASMAVIMSRTGNTRID
jgi:prepilin-type N-terminal cleavage/methylation domain-containing protein